ncbi:oncostatin-M isoform X1 [Molossus molossus]|uniref:oncostatin-M isoform X1 n=1 Tax=Molossus molossus TaxID=27622 RepID=UPI001745CD38|nr:oncostatin-M isoform X1 [Molossus molossus]
MASSPSQVTPPFSAPGLILRLLFLSPVVMGNCSGDGQQLLNQLQNQAKIMQDPSVLLDPYISTQGLNVSKLGAHCLERPGVFPSKHDLQGLSRRGFLQTLNTKLGHVLHRLTEFQQDLQVQTLLRAKMNIIGIRNNIHCMTLQLQGSSDVVEPTPAELEISPLPTLASNAFQRKLQGCQFLHGFHRFMHSAGQVFHKWRETPSRRSRRHSPRRALKKEAHRVQPSMRGKRLMPREQLPR